MKLSERIGWIGNCGFMIGAVLIALKCVLFGIMCNIVGNIMYIVYGHIKKSKSILTLSSFLFVANLIGALNYIGVINAILSVFM